MLCYVMLCYVMLCYVMLCGKNFIYLHYVVRHLHLSVFEGLVWPQTTPQTPFDPLNRTYRSSWIQWHWLEVSIIFGKLLTISAKSASLPKSGHFSHISHTGQGHLFLCCGFLTPYGYVPTPIWPWKSHVQIDLNPLLVVRGSTLSGKMSKTHAKSDNASGNSIVLGSGSATIGSSATHGLRCVSDRVGCVWLLKSGANDVSRHAVSPHVFISL